MACQGDSGMPEWMQRARSSAREQTYGYVSGVRHTSQQPSQSQTMWQEDQDVDGYDLDDYIDQDYDDEYEQEGEYDQGPPSSGSLATLWKMMNITLLQA